MNLWIYVIIVLAILGWLLIPTPNSKTKMNLKYKHVKCPRCGEKVDPIAGVITDKLSHCPMPKCGLELVNLSKLHKRIPLHVVEPTAGEQHAANDTIQLNYEEPLEIHVYSAKSKKVK